MIKDIERRRAGEEIKNFAIEIHALGAVGGAAVIAYGFVWGMGLMASAIADAADAISYAMKVSR